MYPLRKLMFYTPLIVMMISTFLLRSMMIFGNRPDDNQMMLVFGLVKIAAFTLGWMLVQQRQLTVRVALVRTTRIRYQVQQIMLILVFVGLNYLPLLALQQTFLHLNHDRQITWMMGSESMLALIIGIMLVETLLMIIRSDQAILLTLMIYLLAVFSGVNSSFNVLAAVNLDWMPSSNYFILLGAAGLYLGCLISLQLGYITKKDI